jgi:hypothetical protein
LKYAAGTSECLQPSEAVIRFELRNSRPVDLLDLTASLAAFGEAYQDHVLKAGYDVDRENVRLFIREIRTGSIVADLISLADQASFILKHIEVAAGFVTHLNDLLQFFLRSGAPDVEPPTKREAGQVIAVMEPIAKDGGAQLFLQVAGDVHVHHHPFSYSSQEANAIQNAARRYLGPQLPVSQVQQDQLLVLLQVRGDAAAKVGDRGVIEEISPTPVKLLFSSENVKRQIVDQPANPFQMVFVVDVEVKAVEGKVKVYRILSVNDAMERQ